VPRPPWIAAAVAPAAEARAAKEVTDDPAIARRHRCRPSAAVLPLAAIGEPAHAIELGARRIATGHAVPPQRQARQGQQTVGRGESQNFERAALSGRGGASKFYCS
jgi:hypothetical protein